MIAAFWEGYDARLQDLPDTACPYAPGTSKATEWRRGWRDDAAAAAFGQPPARDAGDDQPS